MCAPRAKRWLSGWGYGATKASPSLTLDLNDSMGTRGREKGIEMPGLAAVVDRSILKSHPRGSHCGDGFNAAGDGNVQCAGDGGKKIRHGPKVAGPLRFVSHQVTGHRSPWDLPERRGVSGRQEGCRWCTRLDRMRFGCSPSARDGCSAAVPKQGGEAIASLHHTAIATKSSLTRFNHELTFAIGAALPHFICLSCVCA